MKLLPLCTLILLGVFLHSGSCSGGDARCVPLFVRVGEKAIIKCSVTKTDQDGVYLYRKCDENKKESVLYYYKEEVLTTETPFKNRVETNQDFTDFTVSINNVSEYDGGVYWCTFNKLDMYTNSEQTCLLVQSGIIYTGKSECNQIIYLGVTGGLLFITLVLVVVLVKLCCDHGNYTPKQQPSNGVYEVMRGHTAKTLMNPVYEPNQTRAQSDLN